MVVKTCLVGVQSACMGHHHHLRLRQRVLVEAVLVVALGGDQSMFEKASLELARVVEEEGHRGVPLLAVMEVGLCLEGWQAISSWLHRSELHRQDLSFVHEISMHLYA